MWIVQRRRNKIQQLFLKKEREREREKKEEEMKHVLFFNFYKTSPMQWNYYYKDINNDKLHSFY